MAASNEVATSEVVIDDLQAPIITPLGSLILHMIPKLKLGVNILMFKEVSLRCVKN
jgi:hypothetical protein